MREDRLLLRRLQTGDREALRRIYEKHKDDLLTVAACLVGDRSTAEDCLHEAFVGFAARSAELRLRGSLKSYLSACVANRARDQLRKNARRRPLEEASDVPSPHPNPATHAMAREASNGLFTALGRLPYAQREAIVLHLHGEMKFREIARELGLSTNTVQSRYRYGLEKLRAVLSPGEEK